MTVHLSEEMGRISGSRMQVFQVFSNLIGNAVAHNDSPEPAVEVTCLGEEEGGHRYVVRDNGSGVPPEYLERVFELFFKGEGWGAGIGLATVEKIVKVYDGFVRVYNDGGACFEVCLKDIEGDPTPGQTP
jgi:signal transduction histidine kinase